MIERVGDMEIRQWLKEHPADNAPGAEFALRVCMRFAEEDAVAQHVLDFADRLIQQGNCTPAQAKALFFAWEKTGAEKYQRAIGQVMQALEAQGAEDGAALAFRMAYEMKLNRMERVGQTAAMFRAAGEAKTLEEEAWFLLALTDAIAVCSDQLYEHWRAMVDLYRARLGKALAADAEGETLAVLLWALLSGVEMGLIDPERYLPMARKRLALLREQDVDQAADVLESVFGVK